MGADNYAVEVQPSAPDTMFPVHQLLIRDHGIPLIEGGPRLPEDLRTGCGVRDVERRLIEGQRPEGAGVRESGLQGDHRA